jgi:hypothetical protein
VANAAADVHPPGAAGDQIPPAGEILVEVLPAGNGLFHAKLSGGFILAERSPQPFAAACARLIALGALPDRVATMLMGGVALRSATLGSVAGGGR